MHNPDQYNTSLTETMPCKNIRWMMLSISVVWPCVRDVSDARRPSLNMTREWLWSSRPSGLMVCSIGSGGFMLRKTGAVELAGVVLNISFRTGFSSGRLKSLWVEPMLYSESILPRDGFKSVVSKFQESFWSDVHIVKGKLTKSR